MQYGNINITAMKNKLRFQSFLIALLSMIILQSSVFSQTTLDESFYSPSLNISKYVDIYLPPGYDENPELHYPVIYYLHGWGGNQNFLSTITSYATTKINSGAIEPCIIVCASNYTAPFDGSMYMNSEVHGDYEDYMINDLISWLDTTYRTVPSKEYRSLFGFSMGAYGAFRYGSLHKDKFTALAACAAPANLEVIIDEFEAEIKSEVSGPPYFYNYGTAGNFKKMIFLGAGVWSPNENSPQNYINPQVVEYPFDDQCNLIDTVFNKWSEHQVTNLVQNITADDDIGIFFGCGTSDDLYFNLSNEALKDTLDDLGLDYTYYSFSGGHVLPTGFKNAALDFLDSKMMDPMIPNSDTTQTIDLLAGWNIHSFVVTPENPDMLDIHEDLINSGSLSRIVDGDGAFVQYVPGIGWMNTIGDMVVNKGYYIKVNETTQIDLTGELTSSSCEIPLNQGWNIMGYPIASCQDALSAVQPLIDADELIKVISENGGFIQEIQGIGWINTIGNFLPGEGYYIQVTNNTTITLNCPMSSNMISDVQPALETVLFENPNQNNPYMPMNIIVNDIRVSHVDVKEGDEIAVYDNENIVGTGVITSLNGTLFTLIVAAMDDPTTEEIDGFIEGNPITFRYINEQLEQPIEMTAEDVSGVCEFTPLGTYIASLKGNLTYVVENNASNISIKTYPNPVENMMSIDYTIPHGQVYIGIVNLNGTRIKEVMNEFREEGDHTTRVDVNDLSQGFYVLQVRVVSNGMIYTKFHKFIKI